jgi:hypothetical protein
MKFKESKKKNGIIKEFCDVPIPLKTRLNVFSRLDDCNSMFLIDVLERISDSLTKIVINYNPRQTDGVRGSVR